MIDIIEQELVNLSDEVFEILLKDQTTNSNICWGTELYAEKGPAYYPQEPISKGLITGVNTNIIKPRVAKAIEEQTKRTKDKAEVFTPSWVCNEQNNLVDEAWFGRSEVFNKTNCQTWIAKTDKILFPEDRDWKDYVDAKRLEISCGEAPYLVSRYDTVTGSEIPISQRIGLLDRKIRVVSENTTSEEDWYKWVKRAYESTYGYEYQGDNLLIARENLLYTFIENVEYRFNHLPAEKQLKEIAKIISWNLWQMDGISMTVPYSERPKDNEQLSFFDLDEDENSSTLEKIPCNIRDWRAKKTLEFKSLVNGGE